jgi:spore coat protein U-like protein
LAEAGHASVGHPFSGVQGTALKWWTRITYQARFKRHNEFGSGNEPARGLVMRSALVLLMGCLLQAVISNAQAAVTFTCTVSASSIAFGNYNPLSPTGDAAVGSWTVTCNAIGSGTATVAGTLSLSTGLSGRYSARTMKSGTNALQYNIYLTPSYTQIFGDGSAGTFAPSDSGTVTAGQVYQVTGNMYGFMPPSQDVPAGSYLDSIVVTVTY